MVDDQRAPAVIVSQAMLDTKGSDANGAGRTAEASDRVRLRGWKEIGRHFGVDERTAKRWEAARGLPVHRLPGEARAPVFAFADELDAWVERASPQPGPSTPRQSDPATPPAALSAPLFAPLAKGHRRALWGLVSGLLCAAIAAALWFGTRAIEGERLVEARTQELARLAAGQVASLNDQLESPPGTVAVRAALAAEAVAILGRVAALERSDAALRREAAEAWRRLAVLQNAIDRPSLRDREAARQSLARGLALLDADSSPEAAVVRARLQLEAARQAAGAGALPEARGWLADAEAVALADPSGPLAQDWWLASAEVASWAGDHDAALAAARRAPGSEGATPQTALKDMKARDLEAEALYYLGDLGGARKVYAGALAQAEAAAARWPTDSRLRWSLLRQQWNLGSTLVASGDAPAAVPLLTAALSGWQALASADPSDEALAAWVRATRLSKGQALAAAGARSQAIPVLSEAVAERRQWLQESPGDADRRRMLMTGLAILGDVLAQSGRTAEACALYAETEAMGARMAASRQLTGFDRSERLRLLAEAQARHCDARS